MCCVQYAMCDEHWLHQSSPHESDSTPYCFSISFFRMAKVIWKCVKWIEMTAIKSNSNKTIRYVEHISGVHANIECCKFISSNQIESSFDWVFIACWWHAIRIHLFAWIVCGIHYTTTMLFQCSFWVENLCRNKWIRKSTKICYKT